MSGSILGIHHVTAIGGDPATNVDFYTRVLGLRLVKRTVNFDDPTTWHIYYGDRIGRPGTIMTFFPHPLARRGRPGNSEVARTVFAVPKGALADWRQRLEGEGLAVQATDEGDRRGLVVQDPHGTRLALIEGTGPGGEPWSGSGVPAEMAVLGFDSVRLSVPDIEPTAAFLTQVFGLSQVEPEPGRSGSDASRWFDVGGGQRVEVAPSADGRAQLGGGSVHHVAFRVADDEAQAVLHRRLVQVGLGVTDVQDRQYFRSTYFREPGGVLFEIATDVPGFAIDESEPDLGRSLKLPPWLEPQRAALEQSLPPLAQEVAP